MLASDSDFIANNFEVTSGASEPAAYAVCALKHFKCVPKNEKDVFYYGVFDFGGGTTDFDFGLWRLAKDNEEGYSYVIKHFGANGNGDKYLGGENLLERLSFIVFSDPKNLKIMRDKRISFTIPRGERKTFPSLADVINDDSNFARFNMLMMKEALRPFWEKWENYQEKYYQNNIVEVNLYNNDGAPQPETPFTVDLKILEEELDKRIRNVVKQFLFMMTDVMSKQESSKNKIQIFLAGNSCKAKIVKEIFDQECANIQNLFKETLKRKKHRT
uniref:Uncharacterized protein n=1 Tax=uncultured bacterium contig00062 TaxID=1181545 RepID=A0A806KRA1_9BACT|nr:hypothetical protein with 50bp hit to dihydrolipoamide acetyltransferase [uncultured bacterium contig00062]